MAADSAVAGMNGAGIQTRSNLVGINELRDVLFAQRDAAGSGARRDGAGSEFECPVEDVDAEYLQVGEGFGEPGGQRAGAGADIEHARAGGREPLGEVAECVEMVAGEHWAGQAARAALGQQCLVALGSPIGSAAGCEGCGDVQWCRGLRGELVGSPRVLVRLQAGGFRSAEIGRIADAPGSSAGVG
jgi:hypothetical protein